jgi:hypothetical protein
MSTKAQEGAFALATAGGVIGGGGGILSDRQNPGQDDFDVLTAALRRIRKSLRTLVHFDPPVMPQEIHAVMLEGWQDANKSFEDAIEILSNETLREALVPQLQVAGMTGAVLAWKVQSLNFHLDRIDRVWLTYNQRPGFIERVFKFTKPGLEIMNSFLGSLLKAIPGLEVAKEYKEHVAAGCSLGEAMNQGNEV